MSGFSPDLLTKKLFELNNSQQSIQTLSLWIIHYRKHHKAVVATWFKCLRNADISKNPAKKLTLMYLANDVIQNSRKKAPEYVKEFATVLKPACEAVSRDCDDKTWSSIDRILKIWSDRNIYDKNQLQQFKGAIGERTVSTEVAASTSKDQRHSSKRPSTQSTSAHHNKKSKSHSTTISSSSSTATRSAASTTSTSTTNASNNTNSSSHTTTSTSASTATTLQIESLMPNLPQAKEGVTIDPKQMIRALEELENAPSKDSSVREKIASFPPEVTDVTLINNIGSKEQAERLQKIVEEACILLSDYNNKLLQEMESRKSVNVMLATYISNQKDSLLASEKKLEEYRDKLKMVTKVRSELKCHLANLPDLRALPSVMAPLPSAGDLFTVSTGDQSELKNPYKSESEDDEPRNGHRSSVPGGSVGSVSSVSPSTSSPAEYSDSFSTPN